MPRQIIRVGIVILLATALASPRVAAAARTGPAATPLGQILFQRSFQHLGHAHRFTYHQTQMVLHHFQKLDPSTTRYSIAYLAPDRVAMTYRTSQAVHGVRGLQTVQVGHTKCERWTKWLCFPSPSPSPVALIQPLISPRMNQVTFHVARAPHIGATAVRITWRGHGITYAATMLLQAGSGLPLRFQSVVRQHGEIEVQVSSSFDYSHPRSIRLPHARHRP